MIKESHNFELARLKKKKEKHFGHLATFWFGTFVSVGVLFVLKTLEDEQYVVIKAYKFTILRDFLYYHTMDICAIPTYTVY